MYFDKMSKVTYRNRKEFLAHIELIAKNVQTYSTFCEQPEMLAAADQLVLQSSDLLQQKTESWWREHEEPSKKLKKTSSRNSHRLIPTDYQRTKGPSSLNSHPSVENDFIETKVNHSSMLGLNAIEEDEVSTEEDKQNGDEETEMV